MMRNQFFTGTSFSPDHFALLLQKCLKHKSWRLGKQVHALLLTSGINLNTLSLNSKLVGMYASCGDMESASFIFKRIERPNVFALNWMVLSSTFRGNHQEAIGYFSLMREHVNLFNKFTFSIVLKVCVGLMDRRKGKEVHCVVSKMGMEIEVSVGNALIDMYGKNGDLSYARKVFDKMPMRDVASWTSMISGYCNVGEIKEARVLLDRMKLEGLKANEFTWNAMITGCARLGDTTVAYEFVRRMSEEGIVPDLVTWNTMISGFTQSQKNEEALKVFHHMVVSGSRPNEVTVTGLLPVCSHAGLVHRGREIHGLILRLKLEINAFVATALIDMYSKCGNVKSARNIFDITPITNSATFNAMIGCYGKHGLIDSMMELFAMMNKENGIKPNEVTFACILSAFSHSGEVEKGLDFYRLMQKRYEVEPQEEHCACVVDMLCRAGRLEEAYEFVKVMPVKITESVIGAFFNGCKIHRRRDLANMMAGEVLDMDLKRPGGFVTLSNIYAEHEEWSDVVQVRKMMKQKDVIKKPGFSWVEKMSESREIQ